MKPLTDEQVQIIVNWLNTWEQLRNTAIPLRFKEHFTNKMAKLPEPPQWPLSRVLNWGLLNSAGLCPNCCSTAVRKPWIFGKRYCINPSCGYYNKPIKK